MKIEIRNETAADVAAIEAVTTSAFLHAPHTNHAEQFIVDALRKAGQLTVSLIANADGAVVGHVAISLCRYPMVRLVGMGLVPFR